MFKKRDLTKKGNSPKRENSAKKENSTGELLSNTVFVLKFLYKTNKKLYFIRVPLFLLQTFTTFIPIIFIRLILNSLTMDKNIKMTMIYVAAMAVITFLSGLLNNFLSISDQRQVTKTRELANLVLGKSVMKFPYSELEKPKTKNFVALAQGDSIVYIFNLVMSFLSSLVRVAGLSAIVLTIQPLILLLIAVIIAFKMVIDRKKREISIRWRNEQSQLQRESQYLYEVMREIPYAKEVRLNNLSDWLYNKIGNHTEKKMIPLRKKNNREEQKLNMFVSVSGFIQEGVVYLILAYKVVFAGMGIGDFSMYMTSINSFAEGVGGIFGNFSSLIQQGLFAREFRYCMALAEKNSGEKLGDSEMRGFSELEIEFRNVSFRYPDTDRMILKNVSLTLRPRETLSIVGVNGAGKSTFVKLLCRFYEPTEGEILINGIPVDMIPIEQYNDLIGVVFQDFRLFSFSVSENIALDTVFDSEKLDECIEKSGLGKKISGLALGAETMISKEFDEKGIEFSGGEGQKLAIARSLYKNSPVIILDEPTSALDPVAEYDIYRHFDKLTEGRSTVYISHRLSSTRFTDKIAVFSGGELVEYGNHRDLIKIEDGVYKEMFNMQAQYYI